MDDPNWVDFILKDVLNKLDHAELSNFKSILRKCSKPDTLKTIPEMTLDLANGAQLVEVLREFYSSDLVENVIISILKEMNRADLVELVTKQLKAVSEPPSKQDTSLEPKAASEATSKEDAPLESTAPEATSKDDTSLEPKAASEPTSKEDAPLEQKGASEPTSEEEPASSEPNSEEDPSEMMITLCDQSGHPYCDLTASNDFSNISVSFAGDAFRPGAPVPCVVVNSGLYMPMPEPLPMLHLPLPQPQPPVQPQPQPQHGGEAPLEDPVPVKKRQTDEEEGEAPSVETVPTKKRQVDEPTGEAPLEDPVPVKKRQADEEEGEAPLEDPVPVKKRQEDEPTGEAPSEDPVPVSKRQEDEPKEHVYKKMWKNKYMDNWKNNFWTKCREDIYVDTETYSTLKTWCNPKAGKPFAHTMVLHGPPGSGKTTMAKRLMLEWSESKQAQAFPCAFYISCRDVNNIVSCTFSRLLSLDHVFWWDCVMGWLANAAQFLFVVDGFDELKVSEGSLIYDIRSDLNAMMPAVVLLSSLLKRKLVPHATLLVTTRTRALGKIFHMIQQPVLIETRGFLDREKWEYFRRYFKYEEENEDGGEENALRAFDAVRGNAALFRMASLPAACGVFCLSLELGMKKGVDLALTCQTYTSMFLDFLCRAFSPETSEGHLNRELQVEFKKICLLAADSLLEQLPILSEEDFSKLGLDTNKLHPLVCRYIILKDYSSIDCLSFIYLSIQQLLAAILFVQELGQEGKDVSKYSIQNMISREARLKNPNLTGVLWFVFGLLNETRIEELKTIFGCQLSTGIKRKFLECGSGENKPFLLQMDLQEILSCLYESQEDEFVKEAMALFEEMSLPLKTNTDLIHASFCLKNSQKLQAMSVQVAKEIFPDDDAAQESSSQDQRSQGDQRLLTFWTDFCSVFNSNEKLVFLDISESFFNSSSLGILCEKLASAACRLQKVVLKNISPVDAYKKLCLIFNGYKTLSHLTLQGSNLSTILPSLSVIVKNPTCNLQFLRLESSSAIQKWDDFFPALKVAQSLTWLDLTNNELSDKDVKLLCKTWKQPKCVLQRVSLENCHLTEACCKDLSSVLTVSQTLTHLSLARNNLEDAGVKILCESLSYPECKLQTLVLWSCNITSDGCRHLSKMLRQAPSLEHLDLGLNRIATAGARHLCEALKDPRCNLKSLWLCGCAITPVNCQDFSETLRSNKNLHTLDLGQNTMGTDAVKTFCEDLKQKICPLQTLRLKFDESNPSIQKLIQEMKECHPQLTVHSDQPDPKKKEPSSPHFIF